MNQVQDNEIDLFGFFITLWHGKWKILATTFVASVIGYVFCVVTPNSFVVSTPIQSGKQSVFLKYTSLNDLLKSNQFSISIDEDSIFEMFIGEFNDYEEMVDAVSTSEFVQKSIKDLDGDDKQRALISFAKSFELKAPSKNEDNWSLSFDWHNKLEGLQLLNDAINQTLLNTRNVAKANVDDLAEAIDIRNARNLENLRNELSVISTKQTVTDKKRIQYLAEQSIIAKELGIEKNTLDMNALSKSSHKAISLSVSSNNIPFYLRGYKAIDKEILLIQSRSEENKLLFANGYLEIQDKILSLEKDLLSSQIRKESEVITNNNPNDWVEFDLKLADIISQKRKNSSFNVILFLFLGVMGGVLYVLISNSIRKRKEQFAEV